MAYVSFGRMWQDGIGWIPYFNQVNVDKADGAWERMYLFITVRGEEYKAVLINGLFMDLTFWLESADRTQYPDVEVTLCNGRGDCTPACNDNHRHARVYIEGTATGDITLSIGGVPFANNDPEVDIRVNHPLWTPGGTVFGIVATVRGGVTIAADRTLVVEVTRNGITRELTINLIACAPEVIPCDYCDEYPCICIPCDYCDEYPCICIPCDYCDEYPCICIPCDYCDEYPCICIPCDYCDEYPCICIPCDYCDEYPCICIPCDYCDEYPCICIPCDYCDEYPCICIPCDYCDEYPCICIPCDYCDEYPCICVHYETLEITVNLFSFDNRDDLDFVVFTLLYDNEEIVLVAELVYEYNYANGLKGRFLVTVPAPLAGELRISADWFVAEYLDVNDAEGETVKLYLWGDINADGIVNQTDIALLSDYLLGLGTLTPEQRIRADVTGNNDLSNADLILLQFIVFRLPGVLTSTAFDIASLMDLFNEFVQEFGLPFHDFVEEFELFEDVITILDYYAA